MLESLLRVMFTFSIGLCLIQDWFMWKKNISIKPNNLKFEHALILNCNHFLLALVVSDTFRSFRDLIIYQILILNFKYFNLNHLLFVILIIIKKIFLYNLINIIKCKSPLNCQLFLYSVVIGNHCREKINDLLFSLILLYLVVHDNPKNLSYALFY